MVTEAEVHNKAVDWFEGKGLRVLGFGEPQCELDYDRIPYRPDFFVMPRYAKKKVIAIEVKGSNFGLWGLLGQLLAYSLYYPAVCVAIPDSEVAKLKEIRTKIRRKAFGCFDFKILSIGKNKIRQL